MSSEKTKKNAIFFKKMRFLRKYGAFSTFFRVMKRDGSGITARRLPGMPRKAMPDGGKKL